MLLILRSFSARAARQNPLHNPYSSSCLRLRAISGGCPATSKSDYPASEAKPNAPDTSAGRAAGDAFEIGNSIERLEELVIRPANLKTQRYERSQEVIENKGKCFSHSLQSQEVLENKRVIFVKPRGY